MEKRVVLITGGGRGIGRACAIAFAREGFHVVVASRSAAQLGETVERCREAGARATALALDLRDVESIRAGIRSIEEDLGPIVTLVNAAGVNNGRPLLDVDEDSWDTGFDTNVKGLFFCSQEVARAMIPRGSGSIVNVSSMLAFRGFLAPYGAAKWAVEGITKGLAAELTPLGIRVNSVAPGMTSTSMSGHADGAEVEAPAIPAGRYGSPEEIAAAVVFLASEAASYISGASLVVDGGFTSAWMRLDPPPDPAP